MFKLVKGELKKIFHQPLIYIMAIILCASLVISFFIFKPTERVTSSSSFSLVSSNVSEAKQNFQYKKTELDTGVENLKRIIQDYKAENKSLLLQNYKNSNGQTLSELFSIYNNNCTNTVGVNLDTLNNNLQALNSALSELNDIYTDIISTDIPTVKLTNKTNDEILLNLKNAIEETSVTSSLNYESHKKINQSLTSKNYSNKIKSLFAKIADVGLSQQEINKIITKYIDTEYNQKQNNIVSKITVAETQAEVYELAKEYNANAYIIGQIIYLNVYSNLTNGSPDGVIQNLYNNKILSQKTNFSSENVTKYAINEKLTYYTYLWENNLQDYNFASASNGSVTSIDKATGIDFAIFAFQIASFIIIIYCVIVAATSISNEITFGTLKMIATKPIKRSSIISAKIISTFLVGLIFCLFTAVATFVMGVITYGLDLTNILTIFNASNILIINPILYFLILVACQLIKIFVFITISIFFSTLFKNSIPSLIISLIIFFSGTILSFIFPTANVLAFIPFFNLDFFVYFGGCSLISTTSQLSLLFNSFYLNNSNIFVTLAFVVIVPAIFWILSSIVLKKRDIH